MYIYSTSEKETEKELYMLYMCINLGGLLIFYENGWGGLHTPLKNHG